MFWCWICWMCQAHSCHYSEYTYQIHMMAERRVWYMGLDDIYDDGSQYVISMEGIRYADKI